MTPPDLRPTPARLNALKKAARSYGFNWRDWTPEEYAQAIRDLATADLVYWDQQSAYRATTLGRAWLARHSKGGERG